MRQGIFDIESFHFKQLLFYIISGLFLLYFVYEISTLIRDSSKTTENQLYFLDTIVLQGKAHLRTGTGKSTSLSYDFKDSSGQTYRIDNAQYHAINDKRLIADTLQYHAIKIAIYTNQEGLKIYRSRKKKERIEVLQFSIGGKYYIDIMKLNRQVVKSKVQGLILLSFFYLIGLVFFIKAKNRRMRTALYSQNGS